MRSEFMQLNAYSMNELEDELNKQGASGWQLHSWRILPSPSGISVKYLAILTRPGGPGR